MAQFILPGLPPGAIEIKNALRRYSVAAICIATFIHLSLVGLYWGINYASSHQEGLPPARVIKIVKYSELGPPPSIAETEVAPAISVSGPMAKPGTGIPVPVPDAEVNPEQQFASQTELSRVGPTTDITATESGGVIQDIQVEVEEPPPAFVPFEKEPVCIKKIEPTYPEIAQKAGLTGKVIAYLWVDKQGKVRQVKIVKSDSEIFNQAVIEAAEQYLFTPAMMKNGPVSVWISVPFSFELK